MSQIRPRVVIFGARRDGSAKVLLDIIRMAGKYDVDAFLDDNQSLWGTELALLPILGGRAKFAEMKDRGITGIAFAVGDNRFREHVLEEARGAGLEPVNAIHPSAVVASDVQLGAGIWMAANAVVNPGSTIQDGAVINTSASVDHDCVIEAYASISPGCHLSGRTRVGRYAFLGTGAITLPDAAIGAGATVGAGAVVVKNVQAGTTVVGIPARVLSRG